MLPYIRIHRREVPGCDAKSFAKNQLPSESFVRKC